MTENSVVRSGGRIRLIEYTLFVVALAALLAVVGSHVKGSDASKQRCVVNEGGLGNADDSQASLSEVTWNEKLQRCCKASDPACSTWDGGFPSSHGG